MKEILLNMNWRLVASIAGCGVTALLTTEYVFKKKRPESSLRPSLLLNKAAVKASHGWALIGSQIARIMDIPQAFKFLAGLAIFKDIEEVAHDVFVPMGKILFSPFYVIQGYLREIKQRNWIIILITTCAVLTGSYFFHWKNTAELVISYLPSIRKLPSAL